MNWETGIDTHILLCIKYRTCCTAQGEKRRYNLSARHITGEGKGYPLSILAWRISRAEEPGGYSPLGSQRVGYVCRTYSK